MPTELSTTLDRIENVIEYGRKEQFTEIFPLERVAFRHAIFEWCIRNAQRCFDHSLQEEGLRWDLLAGRIASFGCSPLSSPLLESHLIEIASRLPIPKNRIVSPIPRKCRWLHVLNEALPVGGHTAMAVRWIRSDPDHSRQSVVLLGQRTPAPDSLADAVRQTGGDIHLLDSETSIVERAIWLRNYVWQEADVVVLHIDTCDVISMVALAIPGGPPVVLVNHSAHIFWLGCSIADLVLNCRGSALEHQWTVKYRGIDPERSVTLPIPLLDTHQNQSEVEFAENRRSSREKLKLPQEATIVLTVGSTYKYTPLPGIDFLEAAKQILLSRHDVYLVAVGIDENERWKAVRHATGGRLLAVGAQSDVQSFHAAADVYIEGFPFGSTTALLEAGLRGIPCVLAPMICPPPFASDGPALDTLNRPDTLEDYVKSTLMLIDNMHERRRVGRALARQIRSYHCGRGWVGFLNAVKQRLPAVHKVHMLSATPSVPDYCVSFWSAFCGLTRTDPLMDIFNTAIRLGLKPRFDKRLRKAVSAAKIFRNGYALSDILACVAGLASSIVPFIVNGPLCAKLFYIVRPGGRIMRFLSRRT